MLKRWLALVLSLAVLALPFGASAPARADDRVAAAAGCTCDGPPACAERECPPSADCSACVRLSAFAPESLARFLGARLDAAAAGALAAWHGRVITPAPEPPRA